MQAEFFLSSQGLGENYQKEQTSLVSISSNLQWSQVGGGIYWQMNILLVLLLILTDTTTQRRGSMLGGGVSEESRGKRFLEPLKSSSSLQNLLLRGTAQNTPSLLRKEVQGHILLMESRNYR